MKNAKLRQSHLKKIKGMTFSEILGVLFANSKIGAALTWRISPGLMSWLILLNLVASVMTPFQILIARQVINTSIQAARESQPSFAGIVPWLVLGLGTLLVQNSALAFKEYVSKRFDDEIQFQIARQILQKATELDLAQLDDNRIQDTLERAQSNVAPHISDFVDNGFKFFFATAETIATMAILVVIGPIAAWIMIPIMIPYLWFEWQQGQASYLLDIQFVTAKRWTRYLTNLLLSRESVGEIKLLGLSPLLLDRHKSFAEEVMNENEHLLQRKMKGGILFDTLFGFGFYGAFGWIVWRVVAGQLTVGDIAVYSGAALRLTNTLEQLAVSLSGLLEDSFYVSDLHDFLSIRSEIKYSARAEPQTPVRNPVYVKGEIRFEHVSFRYSESESDILSDIDLTIRPGEVVALAGENGAGKTTFAKLMARLYDPSQGSIYLDGINMKELEPFWIYRQISYLMQNFNRYEGTFEENIAFGDWDNLVHNPEKIQAASRITKLDELINKFPEAYETMLGRRFGTIDLSGGQWQKLAMTRLIARESRIMILDEPTASLDPQAEANLIRQFRDFARGRTALIISHRFSTVSIADRIVVLEKGQIMETGTHEELMRRKGLYTNLYQLHRQQDQLLVDRKLPS